MGWWHDIHGFDCGVARSVDGGVVAWFTVMLKGPLAAAAAQRQT